MKPRVAILTTGGTIVSSSAGGRTTGYAWQGLALEALAADIPGLAEAADVRFRAVCRIPSSSVSAQVWLALGRAIEQEAADPRTVGIVVTSGTDTLEETAYLLNLVLKTGKPVVVTGAMRPATAVSADGPLNLLNAVRIAAAGQSAGRGVLVALNGSILAAREATKTHTLSVETFAARSAGMVGWMAGETVEYFARTERLHTLQTEFSLADLGEQGTLPRVEVLYSAAGEDGAMARAAAQCGAQGIVVAGFGNGSLSAALEKDLVGLAAQGIAIVRASRTGSGPVIAWHERWERLGFVAAGSLPPHKARILLQLLLARGVREPARLRDAFTRY